MKHQTKPNHTKPNQHLLHQIVTCRQKREQSTNNINCHNWHFFFFWTLTTVQFFKEAGPFGNQLCFHFQAKKHLNWWTLSIQPFSVPGHHRNSNLLSYVPEKKLYSKGSNRKMAIEKLTTRLKNKTCNNPQVKNHTKEPWTRDWSHHRNNTKIQNTHL